MKIFSALLFLLSLGVATADEGWREVVPGRAWDFPRDHAVHRDYRTEWWYFTGHLVDRTDRTRRFGFQFTIFKIGLHDEADPKSAWAGGSALMGHAALTDERGERHRFSELLYRENGFLARFGEPGEARLASARAPVGTDGEWTLDWLDPGFAFAMQDRRERFAFSLTTRPSKPIVFHGDGGYSPKSSTPGVASYYYSYTRLATVGSVEIDGERYEVDGQSWMDKEISSRHLADEQVGWDWLSLQLDDGRDLMLFQLRRADGTTDFVEATEVDRAGTTRRLTPGLEAGRRWRSEASDAQYPVAWTIEIDGERLTVEATLDAQENRGQRSGVFYWEGSVVVLDAEGEAIGRGFLEMTGYGEGARPPV